MSFTAKILMNYPVSIASNVTPPSLFTISKASHAHPCLSIPFKPLSSSSPSFPNFLSLKKQKEPLLRVSVIAASEEEDNIIPYVFEDLEQESEGDLNWGASENDGFGEQNMEAKVYVGNLHYDVTGEQLAEIFSEAGVVEKAEVIVHRDTNQSRGFAFVTMSSVEEAEKAMEMFHNYEINGREIIVRKAAPRGSKPESLPPVYRSKSKIYVGNLPWSVGDDRLEELFSVFGRVISARVYTDMENGGRSRGFGFVEMSNNSEMNLAVTNLDGQFVDGRPIKVDVASENRRSSF